MEKDWTFKTLEMYFSEKILALQTLMDQRQTNDEKALDVALEAMNKRLEGLNEFRQALSDQRLTDERNHARVQENLVHKEIYDLEHRVTESLITKNSERITEIDKKLFALSELKADKREGLSSKYMMSAIIFSALSFIIALAGIFVAVSHH